MAISQVQAPKYGAAAADNVTVSFDSAPTAGNLLIAYARCNGSTGAGAITGWSNATYASYINTNGVVTLFYKVAVVGESSDVTLTNASSVNMRLVIEERSGLSATPFDKVASSNTSGSLVHTKTSGTTASTTVVNELCIAAFALSSSYTSASFSNTFTEDFNGNLVLSAYKVVSATGTYETTASWTTDRQAGGVIATFKASPINLGTLVAEVGSFTETGIDVAFKVARILAAIKADFTLTGKDINLSISHKYALVTSKGVFTLTGNNVALTYAHGSASYVLVAGVGLFTLTGKNVTLTYQPAMVIPTGVGDLYIYKTNSRTDTAATGRTVYKSNKRT